MIVFLRPTTIGDCAVSKHYDGLTHSYVWVIHREGRQSLEFGLPEHLFQHSSKSAVDALSTVEQRVLHAIWLLERSVEGLVVAEVGHPRRWGRASRSRAWRTV